MDILTSVRSCILLCALLGAVFSAPAAAVTVHVDPDRSSVVWSGWGCSLCWWANQFGARDDVADVLFTTGTARVKTDTGTYALPGLGMNIARYNIGGTGTTPSGGAGAMVPQEMPPFKRIEGFWKDATHTDPDSTGFDWNVDANQRAMLRKAKARGANLLEAFSNAPMWWMCTNLSTAGSADGRDNLAPSRYGAFASYLATVVRYAHDHWGIDFTTVEPFNEPSAWWWKYPGRQEGCHFDAATQGKILPLLRVELDRRGLTKVRIASSDENSPDDALRTWNTLGTEAKAVVGQVNVHGYSGLAAYRGPNRDALRRAVSAAGRPLWMTEYGENDRTGLTMARSILLDVNEMHAGGWVYWQPLDSGGWGLIASNPGDNWIGAPNPKYYVFAQFSRHIRPGMAILESGDPDTVAAYDAKAGRLALVTVTGAGARKIRFDLSRFGHATGPASRWVTETQGGAMYAKRAGIPLTGGAFEADLAPNTVQTFEIRGLHPLHGPPAP